MKNKIKLCLSPIFASAIISPVACAVSCDSPNWVEPIVMHDINEEWEDPTDYDPITSEEWLDNQEVTTQYVDYMSQNPNHFIEDMLWGVSKRYSVWHDMYKKDEDTYLLKIEKCQFGFSEPTFGETLVWVRGVGDTKYPTVSFREEVEVDYITPDESATSIIKQKINIHIEYNDIILNVIPPHVTNHGIGPSKLSWSIGVLNELSETEALWSYTYNTKPWSITYGCANQIVEEILDDEGNVISELHNTKYYSGLVNNYEGLYDLYVTQADIDAGDSATDRLMREIIVTILNLECQSYLLSEIVNKIDVILVQHAWGEATSQTQTSNIIGFKLINSLKPGYVPLIESISLADDFQGVENGSTNPIIITANKNTQLIKMGDEEYYMPVSLSECFPQTHDTVWHSFNLNSPDLKLIVKYKIGGGTEETLPITVNLHYNTVDIKQAPDPV